MTQKSRYFARTAGLTLALLLSAAPLSGANAGAHSAAESVAMPGGGNTNIAQLKQISGFTGNMDFGYSDGQYNVVGTSFNKFIKLRFTVNCPANYRVHEAGIRVRGGDVQNYDFELVSPGDVPFDQNTWEQALEQEPWKFDAAVGAGIDALDAAGNNGPVYVSLNEVLDSRTEFYGSCSPSQPSSGLPFLFYDSTSDNGHMRPMTRMRYQLKHSAVAKSRTGPKAVSGAASAAPGAERLRHRDRACCG